MSVSLFQAFLMGVVYYLGIIGTPWTTVLGSASLFQKPLVAGTLVGLILGRPAEGVIIGAAIQLPYIAFISAGGTIPSDPGLAGVLGTAFAIVGNVDPATAITIAIPFGLLGTVVWVLHMTIDVAFVHMADKAAEQGDLKKVCFLHVVPPQIVDLSLELARDMPRLAETAVARANTVDEMLAAVVEEARTTQDVERSVCA